MVLLRDSCFRLVMLTAVCLCCVLIGGNIFTLFPFAPDSESHSLRRLSENIESNGEDVVAKLAQLANARMEVRPPPKRQSGDGMSFSTQTDTNIAPPDAKYSPKPITGVIATDTVEGYQEMLRAKHERVSLKQKKFAGQQLRGEQAKKFFGGVPILREQAETPSVINFLPAGTKDKYAGIFRNVGKLHHCWCKLHKRENGVIPGADWGNMTEADRKTWQRYECNDLFVAKRLFKHSMTSCDENNFIQSTAADSSFPLVAIMSATTTRSVHDPTVKVLSLFQLLFTSLSRSLDCGFRYLFVLGYDKGDKFYDSKSGKERTYTWFDKNIAQPLRENNVLISLKMVKVDNVAKKPGPVFLEIARTAYRMNATFMYRVNDDTEFRGKWPRAYTNALMSLSEPYGAVGPNSIGSDNRILTHDFVHRLHMEIFDMNYYPPELPDWWMDDWITHVYGPVRTFHSKKIGVIHHTQVHGQRYRVDLSNERNLKNLIIRGRNKIRKWMVENRVNPDIISEFDHSLRMPLRLGKRDMIATKLKDLPPIKSF